MPTRWKIVIGALVLLVFWQGYILYELIDASSPRALDETEEGKTALKRLRNGGLIVIGLLVIAIVVDVVKTVTQKKPPGDTPPTAQ